MGPSTDPGPSGSARVSKWSVRPCLPHDPVITHWLPVEMLWNIRERAPTCGILG
ncbi:unnamed protein product [Staurois parvus]|uniref:Uncharacterized protein n=1 Tax=Staurois parvus TaxID=386267 RepID=A0ABN9HLG7_9NEOB|nr:unnamed protein product [Staurois parvus]